MFNTYKNQTKDWEKLKSATMKNVIKKFKLILKVQKKRELILYQYIFNRDYCTAADSCICIVCCTHYLIPIKECMNCKSVTMKTWFERLKRKKVKTKDLTSQSIRRISLLGSYLRSQNEINETRVEIITINN